MHVVIVGCGRVGSELAGRLDQLGHSVAIIDRNRAQMRRLPPTFDGRRIVGFGFDRERLVEAGIEQAGGFVAVTNGDNSNIVAARVARETYGVERVVARIYDPRRAAIYERLGIQTVATVAWTTDQVMRRLVPGEAGRDWVDPTGDVCLVERAIPVEWVGKRLLELERPGIRVAAVGRYGSAEVVTRDHIGQDGDVLFIVARTDVLADLEDHLAQGAR